MNSHKAKAIILEGEMETKRQKLNFMWKRRSFVLYADMETFSFCRFDDAELRHSDTITHTTTVSNHGDKDDREFMLVFVQPERQYHIRAASSVERDRWVTELRRCIQRA